MIPEEHHSLVTRKENNQSYLARNNLIGNIYLHEETVYMPI